MGVAAPKRASPSSSTQRFFFVDEKSSSKGKRSHVMKHHIREKKRGKSRILTSETKTQAPGRPTRILPWTRRAARGISELDFVVSENSSPQSVPMVGVSYGLWIE